MPMLKSGIKNAHTLGQSVVKHEVAEELQNTIIFSNGKSGFVYKEGNGPNHKSLTLD